METQNLTITLPADILRDARHLADNQGMSLSEFIASLIEEKTTGKHDDKIARERQSRMMREAGDHRTNGRIPWTRNELHER